MEQDHPNKQYAREYAESLPADLASALGGLTYFRRALHTGVDAFGNRLTPRDRQVAIKTTATLMHRMHDTWSQQGKPGEEGPEQYYRLYDRAIADELINKYLNS